MPTPSLRDRAAGRDVATTSGGPKSVAALIEAQKGELARALPKHLDPDRLARIAVTVVKQTPALARCDATSLLGALMTCAQLGLEPGPLGEAYFVPYGNKVTFIPGYRGLVKLAWQSGQLQSIGAEVVREHDDFDFSLGLDQHLHHRYRLGQERGEVIGAYAAATFKGGGQVFVVMSEADIEAIRKRSRASGNGPWVTDHDAMRRKTAVRQLVRWLPMSTSLQVLEQAAALDGTVRSDYTAALESSAATHVEGQLIEETAAAGEDPPLDVDPETGEVQDPPAVPAEWDDVAAPGSRS